MPPKRNRVQGGNARSRASAVPQGDRRKRARSVLEGDTDQPAATRRRAEEPQQQQLTMSSTVKDILLEGSTLRTEMKLNDFLRSNLGGRGVVDTNENVALEAFLLRPTMFINDNEILGLITALPSYQALEAINKLHHEGVYSLEQWRGFRRKNTVALLARGKINAALPRAQTSTPVVNSKVLKGCYESVYNASWHHFKEVPDSKKKKTGTVMKLEKGEPPQSWTYKKVGETLERKDGVRQSGTARLRLMVLTSDKGWPYTWAGTESTRDCYVNCEVERVWQTVKGDLTKWFSPHGRTGFTPKKRVLIGTPGIGKSMAAGSYLLYQLLHYDAGKLPLVAYIIKKSVYLFDKTKKTVSELGSEEIFVNLVKDFTLRGVKGYIIYDVAEQGREPHVGLPFTLWNMIVVTSPNVNNFKGWKKQNGAMGIVMNCPDESDVRALCVWMKRNEQGGQNEYWKQMKERMDEVGPILRYIFDGDSFTERKNDIDEVINAVDSSNAKHYIGVMSDKLWEAANPSHKLVQIVRVRKDSRTERYLNSPASRVIASKMYVHLSTKMQSRKIFKLLMHPDIFFLSNVLEMSGTAIFMCRGAVNIIKKKLKELKPPEGRALQLAALEKNPEGRPTEAVGLPTKQGVSGKKIASYKVMYKPAYPNFPLVDAFFFMESPRKTLVGLQMTTAHDHHTKTSTVKEFTEYLSWFFKNWGNFHRDLSWEIIYIQHPDSKPMNDWQRCGYVNSRSREEKEIETFWDGKVRQYRFVLTTEFVRKMREMKM